jgi:hypothetical protein
VTTAVVAMTTVLAAAGSAAVLAVAGVTGPAPSTPGIPDPVPTGPDLVRLGEQAARTLAAAVPGDPRSPPAGR